MLIRRSPLKEKQNLTASVQRSKSAQTPSRQKFAETRLLKNGSPYMRGSPRLTRTDQENYPEGARSRTPSSAAKSRTPSSAAKKQRRHLSERMPTPKELPLVGLALSSPSPSSGQHADHRRSPRLATGY